MPAYEEFEASSEIARFVECFWTSVSLQPTNIQVVPDGCVDVVIKIPKDGGLQLDLVGAMTQPKTVAVSMGQQFLGIRFKPGMASSIVDGNLNELTDRSVPAQIWFGNVADSIARKIVRCEDVRERLDLLQQLLDQGFDLAAIAVEAGYYDQPHFTREFLRYAKVTPSVAARKSLKKK